MTSTIEKIQYFEKEPKIYPKRVWGRYRKLKWVGMIVMLAIYYLAPFLRWDRGQNAPDQAILIDMANRRGYFFFIEIWPQEVYYLAGILILAAIALFFITSLAGRVWCGYACPQTVWTDLFVWVERIVQGDRNARKKLDESRWGIKKIWQKGLTHFLWLVIGALTGGAWVFYFNDAPTLVENIIHLEVSTTVLGWIIALTLSTYIMAGFARQQVCKYMCPYARFQSAMFDRDTLIIGYDETRGEPRGKGKKLRRSQANMALTRHSTGGESLAQDLLDSAQSLCDSQNDKTQPLGDCIDCSLCVQVCPMGIDIRNGLQYECIACGLCVDACNNVMDKLNLPRGLIRYDTTINQETRERGESVTTIWRHIFRPRTYYYTAIMMAVGGIMLYSLLTRAPLELHVLHDRNPLFVTLSDGSVRNGYDIKILNKTHQDTTYRLSLHHLKGAHIEARGAGKIDINQLPVFADSVGHFRVFVAAPKQTETRHKITFELETLSTNITDKVGSVFISGK